MNDSERWAAVVARDRLCDGRFVYCVKTTKIFCRPICKARLARRANVSFCDTPAEAEAAGYRACLRCQPLRASYNPEADKVTKVRDLLDDLPSTARIPGLDQLANEVGLTKHHFHRLFKRETGMTPRQYALSSRTAGNDHESVESHDRGPETAIGSRVTTPLIVDDAIFDSGHIDPSLLDLRKDLAVDLTAFTVFHGVVETTCGMLLVAFLNYEVCHLEFGTSTQTLENALELAFPPLHYLHLSIEMADEVKALYLHLRISAIVESLENPNSDMLSTSSIESASANCFEFPL